MVLDAETAPSPPTLCEYAAEVTAERLDRMLSHIDGVRRGEEARPVHQMRVWSRRSRAALEIFRVCYTGKAFAKLEREVKVAADALGEARDLDVMIEGLEARAANLPASQRTGIESFVERLRARRAARQTAVAHAVTQLEGQDLAQRLRDLAASAESGSTADAHAARGKSKARRAGRGARSHGKG